MNIRLAQNEMMKDTKQMLFVQKRRNNWPHPPSQIRITRFVVANLYSF